MKTILIADDHPFTLLGTKAFVEKLGYEVIEVCSNGIAAYNFIKLKQPQIAILDINMPGYTGLEILEKLHIEKLQTKVVLITMHKEYSIFQKAKEYNIGGYLLKEKATTELEECLLAVSNKKVFLSKNIEQDLEFDITNNNNDKELKQLSITERKIVELIGNQNSTKQIADMLFVSEKTIEKHRSNIIEKLQLPKEKNTLLKWAMQVKNSHTS